MDGKFLGLGLLNIFCIFILFVLFQLMLKVIFNKYEVEGFTEIVNTI